MRIVFLGLSITSSWGNGHATNYRALVAALAARGHDVLFLERDVAVVRGRSATCRPRRAGGRSSTSRSTSSRAGSRETSRDADLVVVGSYVPERGRSRATGCSRSPAERTAFYDIDTPVTVAKLARRRRGVPLAGARAALRPLPLVHRRADARAARARVRRRSCPPLYCSADPGAVPSARVRPERVGARLPRHLQRRPAARARGAPARARPRGARRARFVVAGPQYPPDDRHGRRTSSGSSICRRPSTRASTPRSASRSTSRAATMVARRLVAQRAPVRGRGVRRPRHHRPVGGARRVLRARRGDPRRRPAATTSSISSTASRPERARAIGAARTRTRGRGPHPGAARARSSRSTFARLALVAP